MASIEDILNYTPIDGRLASSGQPRPEQFPLIAAAGFTAIINLATTTSTGHLPEEPELWARFGLDFTWHPVEWNAPTCNDYLQFQQWLDSNRHRKVLVHCALNFRASLFCALYRVIREGLSPEKAREEVLEVWEPDETWTAFARTVLIHAGMQQG